jgi:excisionase family DNA binding protein
MAETATAHTQAPSAPVLHELFPVTLKGSYRVREAARILGVSRQTLQREIDLSILAPVLSVGKRGVRIPATTLRSYIDAKYYDPFA